MDSAAIVDPWSSDAEDALLGALYALKADARAVDPDNFWLTASDVTNLGYVRLILDIARELLPRQAAPASPLRVLDWGGGPGFLAYLLERLGFAVTYYDFHYGYASYDLVLGGLEGNVVFVEDPVAMPFDDASFDAVVSFGVLEHVAEPAASLDDLHRVLEPDGKLFVYHFPNRWGYIEGIARPLGKSYHEYKLSRSGLADLVTSHGFDVSRLSYRYLVPRNFTDLPRLRGFINRHAKAVYVFDSALTKVPGLRGFSTTLNLVCSRREG